MDSRSISSRAVFKVVAITQLAGILGALLAIPTAASLGAVYDELWPAPDDATSESGGAVTAGAPAP
jgi:predicted PurR-regulated permease PerM